MKVLDVIHNGWPRSSDECVPAGWRLLADSNLLSPRHPFFIPDFEGGVVITASLAVRVSRLGKGIASRFAGRYYSEGAAAVAFPALSWGDRLVAAGLPDSPARAYDKSLATGSFGRLPDDGELQLDVCLHTPGGMKLEVRRFMTTWRAAVAGAIEAVSRDNTLKTGDLLLCGTFSTGWQPPFDSRLEASLSCGGTLISTLTVSIK